MKTSFEFLQDFLPQESIQIIDELYIEPSQDFVKLSNILKLDPTNDFKNADLSGVDFTGADLTNYNFSFSDLRGSYGTGVTFPPPAALLGADLEGSIFAHQNVLAELRKNIDRPLSPSFLNDQDPLSTSVWILENTKENSVRRDQAILVTLENFRESKNATIISDSIYAANGFFTDREKYFEFLIGVISEKGGSARAMATTLNMLSAGFSKNPITKKLFLSYLRHEERVDVISTVLKGISRIELTDEEQNEVDTLIGSHKLSSIRRYLLAMAVLRNRRRYGFLYAGQAHEPENLFDPANEIDHANFREFYRYVEARLVREAEDDFANARLFIPETAGPNGVSTSSDDLDKRISISLLDDLDSVSRLTGLAFKFESNLAEALGLNRR